MYLLFSEGQRPAASDIEELLSRSASVSVSLNPVEGREIETSLDGINSGGFDDGHGGNAWLEILCDGLTFDMSGLAGGNSMELPDFGDEPDSEWVSQLATTEAILLAPGPHLAGGENSLPVMRSMMALAASLTDFLPHLVGFCWPPARRITQQDVFTQAIDAWLVGGLFPVPELISLHILPNEGLRSEGLSFFTGQELLLDAAIAAEPNSASRLAARLLNQLVLQGRIEVADQITGPDGNPLRLELSRDHATVIVQRG